MTRSTKRIARHLVVLPLVVVVLLSGLTAATTATVTFTCTARVTDGTFTVPPVVLLALPPTAAAPGATFATPGSLSVSHVGTTVTQIRATGIEIGGIGSVFAFGSSATYQ